MECFVVFLMTLAVVTSFPLKKEEDSPLKRKILRPTYRRLINEPDLNDPIPFVNWPWSVNVGLPNGGVNVGGVPNNNGGHGVGVKVGWPNWAVNVGAGHNNNGEHRVCVNVGGSNGGFNLGFGKRNIEPALNDPAEQSKGNLAYNGGNGINGGGNWGSIVPSSGNTIGGYYGYGKRKIEPHLNDPAEQSKRNFAYNGGNGINGGSNWGGIGPSSGNTIGGYYGYGKRKIDPNVNGFGERDGQGP